MKIPDLSNYDSVFNLCTTVHIRRASEVLRTPTSPAVPLWPPFWHEGEICVFFSETNVGKSIVAVQIADDLSRGVCSLTGESIAPRRVLYFDYELTDRQFISRYGGAAFDDRFYRAAPKTEALETVEIEKAVFDIVKAMKSGYSAIVVDNITFISNAIKDAANSLQLMKTLKANAARYGCSLLLIAHTPKRQQNKILTKNDLSGSSNILNFADSAFALGRSYLDPNFRYLKQIKAREASIVYNENEVLVGVFQTNGGMLRFTPVITQSEYLHIEK